MLGPWRGVSFGLRRGGVLVLGRDVGRRHAHGGAAVSRGRGRCSGRKIVAAGAFCITVEVAGSGFGLPFRRLINRCSCGAWHPRGFDSGGIGAGILAAAILGQRAIGVARGSVGLAPEGRC